MHVNTSSHRRLTVLSTMTIDQVMNVSSWSCFSKESNQWEIKKINCLYCQINKPTGLSFQNGFEETNMTLCKYGRCYCLAPHWLLVNNLKTKAAKSFKKSCDPQSLSISDLVVAEKMSYNFKGQVHSWPRSVSICSQLWNKSVYVLKTWYCVSGLTCRGCFPFMSRKVQGCPLGPWCKSFPHIFLNYLGPQARDCKGPRQGLSGDSGRRIEGRFVCNFQCHFQCLLQWPPRLFKLHVSFPHWSASPLPSGQLLHWQGAYILAFLLIKTP